MVKDLTQEQIEAILRIAAQVKPAANGNGQAPLPEDTIEQAWARWDVEVLRPRDEQDNPLPSSRADIKDVLYHRRFIVDLVFPYEGQKLRMGDVRVCDLTLPMGKAWKRELIAHRRTKEVPDGKGGKTTILIEKDGKPVYFRPASINRICATFMSLLTYRIGDDGRNPLHGIGRESTKGYGRQGWFQNEEELADFLAHADEDIRDMFNLVCNNGGMRKQEVRLLKISHVDFTTRSIRLPAGKQCRTGEGTKNEEGRSFPVRDSDFDILVRRRARAEALGTPYLFPDPTPRCGTPRCLNPIRCRALGHPVPKIGPFSNSTMYDKWRKAVDSWGQTLPGNERPIFHHGRATFGTWSAIKGVDPNDTMVEAGWTDPKMMALYRRRADALKEKSRTKREKTIAEALAEEGVEMPPRQPPRRGPRRGGSSTEAA